MLALFKRLFRRLKRDGVRAPDIPSIPRGLSVDGEWLIVRIPIPPEKALLEMLYEHREHQKPMGVMFQIDFDGDFCEQMLSSQRAATPGPRETKKATQ
jgi:hypothetical protein